MPRVSFGVFLLPAAAADIDNDRLHGIGREAVLSYTASS